MFCRHYMVRSTPTVLDTATLAEAMATMIKHHRQQLLVVNAQGEYVGEITTFILAKLLLPPGDGPQTQEEAEKETVVDVDDRIAPYLNRKVGDFAANDLPIMHPDTPLVEAVRLLAGGKLRLPVVDPQTKKFVGAISSLSVLRRYQF
jgi:CBS domain-containing protein